MSVSIKNMDMPKNCDECLFSGWSNLHQTAACKLLEYEPCFADFSREYESARSVKCPLVAPTIEPSAQPEPHWIPCSVKLPTEGQLIYASFPYLQDYVVVKYCTELRDAIDAWIPLPESYERK